jgi:hypothetical protein
MIPAFLDQPALPYMPSWAAPNHPVSDMVRSRFALWRHIEISIDAKGCPPPRP